MKIKWQKTTDAPSSILHHMSHLYHLNIAVFIYFLNHTQKNPSSEC